MAATRVTDSGLNRHISEMPQLRELSLAYLDITDEGLAGLDCLTWLERLNLRHTSISRAAIVDLVSAKAHTLRRLNLSNTVIDDAVLADFPEQSQLHELSLIDTSITDKGCKHIARCEWLTDLHLDLTDITDDGVRFLAECRHLEIIELLMTKVGDTGLVWLSDTKVKHLGLGQTSVTDAGIPVLTDYTSLSSLDLQTNAITDKGLRFLSEVTNLDRLYLENTRISNVGIEFLLRIPLKSLSLNHGIDDTGLKTLSHHDNLRHLAIWGAKVSSWEPLKRLDRIQVLLIDDSVKDLSPLQTFRQLQVLLLWGRDFLPAEVARLRLSLPTCRVQTFPPHARAICAFRKLCRGD